MRWLLIGVLAAGAPAVDAQTIPERIRSNPSAPIVTGVLREVAPLPVEDPTEQAELVVVGRLSAPRSSLSGDQTYIRTEYEVTSHRVIAGTIDSRRAEPGLVPPVILAVYGGRVTVDGVEVRSVDHNMNDANHSGYFLRPGGEYLLFLKRAPSGAPGRYQLVMGGAFEIDEHRARPVLKGYDEAFRDFHTTPVEQILSRVENAAKAR